jgi:hypothetical protein
MKRNKVVKISVIVILLLAVVAVFCLTQSRDSVEINAKTNQQEQLQKDKDDQSLWEKYLVGTSGEVYRETKDYLLGLFQKRVPKSETAASGSNYALHENISTTVFWVGEGASDANDDISNSPSCWDEKWSSHFGGIDKPNKRDGYLPAGFKPKENPFYVALPYNDFNSKGNRKSGLDKYIPWFNEKKWQDNESVCKNRWIKIIKGDKVAYGQWEDAGPFGENDIGYVFGKNHPKSKDNDRAGLDVSPAIRDYLGLSGMNKTSWQFVDADDVPNGPWKNIVTASDVYWK